MGYPYSAQPVLVSGANIKTIGGESVLGSGDIDAVSSADLNTAISALPTSSVGTRIKPLFYDRLANEVACSQHIPGSHSPSYAPRLTGAVSGPTFTITGGDSVSLFGTGAWAAVLYDSTADETYNCIVLSRSDSTVNITPPAPFSGSATLYVRHDSTNGQHLSTYGYWALADDLLRSNFEPLECVLRLSPRYVQGVQSPSYWTVYNGAAANTINNRVNENIAGSDGIVNAQNNYQTRIVLDETEGFEVELILDEEINGEVHLVLGHNGPFGTATTTIQLLVDGVVIDSDTNYGFLQKHRLKFGAANRMTLRVVSAYASGSVTLVIGDVAVHNAASTRPFLLPNQKLLLVGDSWTAEEDFPGLTSRLDAIHDGPVVSVGVSGTNSAYALAVVGGARRIDTWLDTHSPDVCLIHYYINDSEDDISRSEWAANLTSICDACVARGVQPVVVLPGCTASFSQTQSIVLKYAFAFDAPYSIAYPGDCKSLDFSSADSQINRLKKVAGRAVRDSEANRVYVASGSRPSDAWFDVVTPANVVVPKTFAGAEVLLSELSRFYGAEQQNASVLFDSSSNASNGTVTGSIDYTLDPFGTRRRNMAMGTGTIDCGTVLPLTTSWTMGGWFRFSSLASIQVLMNQCTSSGNCGFGISSGSIAWFIAAADGQPAVSVTNGPVLANLQWHHLAMRRNGNVFTYLLNGVVQLTQTDTGTRMIQNGPLKISGDFGADFKFQGTFADLFVANSALSDSDIAWLADFENFII